MPKARPTHFAADPLATSADATEVHVVAFNPCRAAVATTLSCYDRQGMHVVSASPVVAEHDWPVAEDDALDIHKHLRSGPKRPRTSAHACRQTNRHHAPEV